MLASHHARRRHRSRGERHRARCGPDPPGTPLGLRQDRHRRLRPRPGRARRRAHLHRRHREGARRGRASRSARSTTSPGFPEIMDGRVKTLHPKLHAGLLAVRVDPEHVAAAAEHGIEPIDLVCVNLYPFERTAARRGVSDAEVIENIDIGGPTMIRAAAKNHAFAAVVVKPEAYDAVLEELRAGDGMLSMRHARGARRRGVRLHRALRHGDRALVRRAAPRTSRRCSSAPTRRSPTCSYGENPHQRAAYYQQVGAAHAPALDGRASTTASSSRTTTCSTSTRRARVVREFEVPACVIVKHNNPCGVAVGGGPRSRPTSAPSRATRSAPSAASSR